MISHNLTLSGVGKIMDFKDFRVNNRLNTLNSADIEQIYTLIAEIDAIKNSWHISKQLSPRTIERLTHSVIVTSTASSNRIEGNKLTDQEVENLYKNLHIKKLKSRDEQEVVGYLEVLKFIFNNYKDMPITESSIFQIHSEMLNYSDKDQSHKGRYKNSSNRVEARDFSGNLVGIIFEPTAPYLVKKEMHELIDWYNLSAGEKAKHPLILIANFIFEFLAIHPFQDGNGRVSRLLTNLMLLQTGYYFTTVVSNEKIVEDNKIDYYLALNKVQATWKTNKENITPWLIFFLTIVQIQANQALTMLKNVDVENLLSAKQLALWQWAAENESNEFSRKDAVNSLGFPERTVESCIKKLVELKKLQRIGEGKATRYKVIK